MKSIRVYTNPDGETPLHVHAEVNMDDGLVVLRQGGDRDAVYIPMTDWNEFVASLAVIEVTLGHSFKGYKS